ncbi:MAG: methytransferase partner Trm112 [Chloroflexi bacterium]|nr:methytransferase partner Trm112 [Chloroflexota bacterium]
MKKDLLPILACPVCRGPLVLSAIEETEDDVVSGALRCQSCQVDYPIANSIPNLLPPQAKASGR